MAASMNKVFLMGNLTKDPELRYIPSGSAVANFTVAVNRIYKDSAGQKKEDASFIRVVVWGKMAEVCGEYLTKGRPVLVEGRLKSRVWEAQDGQKRSAIDVVATSVQFLGAKSDKVQKTGSNSVGQDQDYSEIGSIDVDQEAAIDGDVPF